MHYSVLEFFILNTKPDDFNNKEILEIGSKYVNGSVRPFIEGFCKPKLYWGIDIEDGKFVDQVLPVEKLVEYFGENKFDVVISTELLEHVVDWKITINNMKKVLKSDGFIWITTRSFPFLYHAYPYDFWRYEIEDIEKIFADFNIMKLLKDPELPGVLLKAQKPLSYESIDISDYYLYSMLTGNRISDIPTRFRINRRIRLLLQEKIRRLAQKIPPLCWLK
jgi:SAM-dependent methyltransferase